MEIERHQRFEFCAGGAEQFFQHLHMRIHRPAYVEKQQHLHRIAPLWPGLHIQIAMIRRRANGAVQIKFFRSPIARPFAQTAKGDLDIAGAKFHPVIQIAKFALVPNLDRAAVAALILPDAHAFGIVAISPKGRGARRADPFIATLMATLLCRQPLPQPLHQRVKST